VTPLNLESNMKMMKPTYLALAMAAALPLAVFAQGDTPSNKIEKEFQAGTSPVGQELMHQSPNPKAPPMTEEEFGKARNMYFERCAGTRHHRRQGHGLPEGVHRLRLAGRHAELVDQRRTEREGSRHARTLRAA